MAKTNRTLACNRQNVNRCVTNEMAPLQCSNDWLVSSWHTQPVNLKRRAIRAAVVVSMASMFAFAQGAKTTGTVAPNLVEFRIPLEQPAGATWTWNRGETPDNDGEYTWQVAVPNAEGRYAFGFYLYKMPGSKPAHGDLQALLKAGQASVFKEDATGRGTLMPNAAIGVSAENDEIILRMTDAELIGTIFAAHPESATINTRGVGAKFEVVKIEYR